MPFSLCILYANRNIWARLSFFKTEELLSYKKIKSFTKIFVHSLGVNKIRITDVEPLIIKDLPQPIKDNN